MWTEDKSRQKKHKIVILGDSHVEGLSEIYSLDGAYSVMGWKWV